MRPVQVKRTALLELTVILAVLRAKVLRALLAETLTYKQTGLMSVNNVRLIIMNIKLSIKLLGYMIETTPQYYTIDSLLAS